MTQTTSGTLPSLSNTLKTQFDPSKSSVISNPLKDKLIAFGFGRTLTDLELIQLCGAPSGSTLKLEYNPASSSGEEIPEGLKVSISNSAFFDVPMKLIFYINASGKKAAYINLVIVSPHCTVAATGGLILETMLRANDLAALEHKIVDISMLAAGGRTWDNIGKTSKRWGGYAAWPRYGFDMPIGKITKAMFKHFPHVPPLSGNTTCTKISALLTLEKGLQFWDLVGDGWYMNFDTSTGSKSRKTLTSYLAGKYS